MLPDHIKCPHRRDGNHPNDGKLSKKDVCLDCGEKYTRAYRPSRMRASARGRVSAILDYEGRTGL